MQEAVSSSNEVPAHRRRQRPPRHRRRRRTAAHSRGHRAKLVQGRTDRARERRAAGRGGQNVVNLIVSAASQAKQASTATSRSGEGGAAIVRSTAQMRVGVATGRAGDGDPGAVVARDHQGGAVERDVGERSSARDERPGRRRRTDRVRGRFRSPRLDGDGARAQRTDAAAARISAEAESLTKLIASVGSAMFEQASAAEQMATATDTIRRQTDQTGKAMAEQSRAAADLTSATRNVAKQMVLITRVEQGAGGRDHVVGQVSEREAQRLGSERVRVRAIRALLTEQLAERARAFDLARSS